MKQIKNSMVLALIMLISSMSYGHYTPDTKKPAGVKKDRKLSLRAVCAPASSETELNINNVRARLLGGGDMWWDLSDARYVIPKVDPASGLPEISSLFAGSVWIGGFQGGNLKIAALDFRNATKNEWWPGPLDTSGTTNDSICKLWNQHFEVSGKEIRAHQKLFDKSVKDGVEYNADEIPEGVKYWPATGNEFFEDKFNFKLPFTSQGLGSFFDVDEDGIYEPQEGDFPSIEVDNCPDDLYPDQMIFWIYNDNGDVHTSTMADAIQMEVQVQAFAFQTADEINDMTFYRHKLINRATQDIDSCYFGMWVDADLGCPFDDFIGCDTTRDIRGRGRDLMYIYNSDEVDGTSGTDCRGGVPSYGFDIPILGVDYFRGPKKYTFDANDSIIDAVELGMSSFTYYNNSGFGNPAPATTDPSVAGEFYNYLTGSWRDGTRFTEGGNAYNIGSTDLTNYAFPDQPNVAGAWSMCESGSEDGDRRTIQASGPFRLTPGAVNELIIGVVWVPEQDYPCPGMDELIAADSKAQDLFDNCFDITDGPTAPDVDVIELNQKIILLLTNDESSNNFEERYEERIIGIPIPTQDTNYVFEGYRVFQVSGPGVSKSQLGDPDRSREIATLDLKNGIQKIYNWTSVKNPDPTQPKVWSPTLQVEGVDEGIRHSLEVTKDAFTSNDMINHQDYYFFVVAYGHNDFATFDFSNPAGTQATSYINGRLNVGIGDEGFPYKATPRPILYQNLNTVYGAGPEIVRYDGIGVGGNFVKMSEETEAKLFDGSFTGEIKYKEGFGPVNAKIYDPLRCKDSEFTLFFRDEDMSNTELDDNVRWMMVGPNNDTIRSERNIDHLNEQLIQKYGFSLTVGQTEEPGDRRDNTNGAIGAEYSYKDATKPFWLKSVEPNNSVTLSGGGRSIDLNFTSFIKEGEGTLNFDHDVNGALGRLGNQGFLPYALCASDAADGFDMITPGWLHSENATVKSSMVKEGFSLLNNVDIVFTSDKSKWSRCVIVETNNSAMSGAGIESVDGTLEMHLRGAPSVSKEADADGNPIPDDSGTNGMGWFPGYAIDVETGERLNVFFGENSAYNDELLSVLKDTEGEIFPQDNHLTGADMMWNPTSERFFPQLFTQGGVFALVSFYYGGHHKVYVTDTKYDSCAYEARQLVKTRPRDIGKGLRSITWAGITILNDGERLLSYNDGLIPNEARVSLRVDNPYEVSVGTNENNGYNKYKIKFSGVTPSAVDTKEAIEDALESVNVVPNPYYGFSTYEVTALDNNVKITNLPDRSVITIYSLDGKFIKKYDRDERPQEAYGQAIIGTQTNPDVVWDLKNDKGIPVSSGVYIIHINDLDSGAEKIIKWFGIARKFDPSGL